PEPAEEPGEETASSPAPVAPRSAAVVTGAHAGAGAAHLPHLVGIARPRRSAEQTAEDAEQDEHREDAQSDQEKCGEQTGTSSRSTVPGARPDRYRRPRPSTSPGVSDPMALQCFLDRLHALLESRVVVLLPEFRDERLANRIAPALWQDALQAFAGQGL